jgi:hypothetical protein
MCCIKDLNLFPKTVLYDASVVNRMIPSLPSPLNETTPLEVAISISQFYAFYSLSRSGLSLISSSLSQLHYLRQEWHHAPAPPPTTVKTTTTATTITADRLVRDGLIQAQQMAWRNLIIGCNVLPIGISFFWLFANSWHVTSTNWIGGLQGLIHALTAMELCLVPLLYYMLVSAQDLLIKSRQYSILAMLVQTGNMTSDHVTLSAYQTMTKWTPYWENQQQDVITNNNSSSTVDAKEDAQKKFQKEVQHVKTTLETLVNDTAAAVVVVVKGEKEDKIFQTGRSLAANHLLQQAKTYSLEGYREYIYFVVNFIAFYGYFLGVLCYYTTDEDDKRYYIRQLKLGMSHVDADWHGNFAGDFMWTIEPLIILGSPRIIRYLTQTPTTRHHDDDIKVKSE